MREFEGGRFPLTCREWTGPRDLQKQRKLQLKVIFYHRFYKQTVANGKILHILRHKNVVINQKNQQLAECKYALTCTYYKHIKNDFSLCLLCKKKQKSSVHNSETALSPGIKINLMFGLKHHLGIGLCDL